MEITAQFPLQFALRAAGPQPQQHTDPQPEQSHPKEAPCCNIALLLETNGERSIFNLHFKTKASNIQTINLATRLSQQNLLHTMCSGVIKVY